MRALLSLVVLLAACGDNIHPPQPELQDPSAGDPDGVKPGDDPAPDATVEVDAAVVLPDASVPDDDCDDQADEQCHWHHGHWHCDKNDHEHDGHWHHGHLEN